MRSVLICTFVLVFEFGFELGPRFRLVALEQQFAHAVHLGLEHRIHGFELLMASYAMCHMKLDMILTELGYDETAIAALRQAAVVVAPDDIAIES